MAPRHLTWLLFGLNFIFSTAFLQTTQDHLTEAAVVDIGSRLTPRRSCSHEHRPNPIAQFLFLLGRKKSITHCFCLSNKLFGKHYVHHHQILCSDGTFNLPFHIYHILIDYIALLWFIDDIEQRFGFRDSFKVESNIYFCYIER